MTQRSIQLATTLSAVLLAPLGCTQHYNGSLGVASDDREAVAQYHAQKAQRDVALQPVAAPATPATPAAPAMPTTPQAVSFTETGAAQPPSYTPGMAHLAVGRMGLYGQVGDAPAEGQSSPLDGPGDIARVTFTTEGADFDPDVDPTGTLLVYASTRHRDTADLYLKSVRGNAVTQLTNDPANEVMPAFSPDGSKVAFASDRSGNWDIYLMDARGGQAVQITGDPTHDLHPSFSPDGRRLVYCSHGGPSGQWELVVVDVNNPTTRRVIGNGLFPAWSPAGDQIVFQRARQRGTRWFSVWTMGVTEDDVTPPTEIAVSSNAAVITPDWSPDGRHVVFCTVIDPSSDEHQRPSQADVWVVAADGTGRTKLTEGRFANLQPVWAADNAIYFVSDRGAEGAENVWAMQGTRAMELAGVARETHPSAMAPTP